MRTFWPDIHARSSLARSHNVSIWKFKFHIHVCLFIIPTIHLYKNPTDSQINFAEKKKLNVGI